MGCANRMAGLSEGAFLILLRLCWGLVLGIVRPAWAGEDQGYWDARFYLPGLHGQVRAMAGRGSEIFLGGRFTSVGAVRATNLARWDGEQWRALPGDMNGEVNALALQEGRLFAGGTFTQVGGVNAGLVAQWDGSHWSMLGPGLEGSRVTALALDAAGALYAGGEFTQAGGVAAVNVARWDGTHWSPLGAGLSNDPYDAWVLALAVRGTEVFAGGFFTQAGSVNANCIARWDGSAWSALGAGVDDRNYLPQVTSLSVRGSDLFVGGAFAIAGTGAAAQVARWDGTHWFALGQGLGRYFGDIPVQALAETDGDLVVGGRFVSAGGLSVSNVALWNGTAWSGPGQVEGEIQALLAQGDNFWAGGSFVAADSLNNLAQWDGSAWSAPGADNGAGITGDALTSMAAGEVGIFAAGTFTAAGRTAAANVARWDGSVWTPMGEGLNGTVYALDLTGKDLFVGGRFTEAGGLLSANVARWDGTNWASLGAGIDGTVYALAWDGGQLYAGGTFSSAGGVAATNVARWDGTGWFPLGPGISGTVRALAVESNSLFAGGSFRMAGHTQVMNLARWDGTNWFDLGGVSGTANPIARLRPPPVSALLLMDHQLIVGGDFAQAGNVAATNIARWDGADWHPLGAGIAALPALFQPPTVTALVVCNGRLAAGGNFERAGVTPAKNLARWDGQAWSGFGPEGGLNGAVQTLAVASGALAVGGRFSLAGGVAAENFCIWHPAARLQIRPIPGAIFISWPSVTADGVVEASEAPSVGSWLALTNRIAVSNGVASITEVISQPGRFYRLRFP
jgi:trimeric autotransporter adhesin